MPRREFIKPLQNVGRAIRASRAYLEPGEISRLEESAANLRDRLLIRLLFHLGCRISEALGLEVKDIDFGSSTVVIEHLKYRVKMSCPKCGTKLGKSHKFCPLCGNGVEKALAQEQEHRRMRTLPIDDNTLRMLRDYIQRGGPVPREGKRLIFGINRHRGWQIIRECAQKAGLPRLINSETGKMHNVSPHQLRDAFAVHAVKLDDSGDGLRMLQEHLGHQSISTTMGYRKVAGGELRTWYKKLWEEEEGG